MEGIGSLLFLFVFLTGLVLLLKKGNRLLGVLIMLVACFFLFYLPGSNFNRFKEDSLGVYRSDSGYKLTIYASETFSVYDIHGKAIDTGNVEFTNIDLEYINLYGKKDWLEKKKEGEICCAPDGTPFKR